MAAILIVVDDPHFCAAAAGYLQQQGHEVTPADSLTAARRLLGDVEFDVLVTDLALPDGSGLALLEHVSPASARARRTRSIVIAGHNSTPGNATDRVQGAHITYLNKPVDLEALNACCVAPTNSSSANERRHFGALVGESEAMGLVYEQIRQVASTDSAVLIVGESGTGKELVASAIHQESGRCGPLVPINCGALTSGVVGSELFGHEKGSFTGAHKRHIGAFEQAANGTLFLDEVTEMPLTQQPLLLRTLETRSLYRVGSERAIHISARIISATNCDLESAIAEGKLRKDLYYRLNLFPITLPPLRERMEDLEPLAASLLADLNVEYCRALTIQDSQLATLRQWHWPGNVRELKHFLHRAVIATPAEQTTLRMPDLPAHRGLHPSGGAGTGPQSLRQRERDHILEVLRAQRGSRKRSAELLGVSAKTLYNRISEYQKAGDPDFLALRQPD